MASMARDGDVRAQREYGAWLRRLAKSRRAYREAAENEEVETMAGFGYEVRVCVCVHMCVGAAPRKYPCAYTAHASVHACGSHRE